MRELGIRETGIHFDSRNRRQTTFQHCINMSTKAIQGAIRDMATAPSRHILSAMEADLASLLVESGFIEVKTPTIISTNALDKMGIGQEHPLFKQVFHIDDKRCMRPMLAPNLYTVMSHMRRTLRGPVKLFEIGPCYRKESRSGSHMAEFTMLNAVVLGPDGDPSSEIKDLISRIMDCIGLDYELSECESDVYKSTIDVEIEGQEVASAATGPHELDASHGIEEPWCGVGFGLERLLMLKGRKDSVRRVGRNLVYQNGIRIDI